MRIDANGNYGITQPLDTAAKSLYKTNRDLNKILQRLSTALRINSAADDAAGLGVSEQLRTQVRGFQQASRNATDAMSALNIAEGTGNEVSSMLQRQRELAIQSQNATLTDNQRKDLNVEYQQISQEMDRITGSAQFNSQSVANGTGLASGTAQVQAGANAGDSVTLPVADMSAHALLIAGTSIDTAASAATALNRIDTAIETVNSQRSSLGAMTNRFESAVNNLSIAEINTQAAESVLRDQDMAQGLAEMTRVTLLQSSTLAAFSKFREISSNNLFALLK
jgi:flagellin